MTPDLKTKIADLLRAKHPLAHIARDLGVSLYIVRKVRASLNIEPRKKWDQTPYFRRRLGEAILLKRCGFTEEQIGQKMGGISKQRVSKMLRGLKVEVICRKCGQPTTKPNYFHKCNGEAPDTYCPGCTHLLLSNGKVVGGKPMDERTKRFLTRHQQH